MPHGMMAWMGPFYKPQGEGVSIRRYQPPGIKSTSILEEDMSYRHNSQISPLIRGKITKYGKYCVGLCIEGSGSKCWPVYGNVFVTLGRDVSFSQRLSPPRRSGVLFSRGGGREKKMIKKAFLFLESFKF